MECHERHVEPYGFFPELYKHPIEPSEPLVEPYELPIEPHELPKGHPLPTPYRTV